MKNIEMSVIEKFNESLESGRMPEEKEIIEQFIKITIIHLEEDIKTLKYSTYLNNLYRRAIQAEEKVLKNQPLNIDDFQNFNIYNSAKVKEIKWIAAATVILIIVAAAFRIKLS